MKAFKTMWEILKIIHFLSFSVAIGAGVSNLALGARMASFPPASMPQVGGYRLLLGKLSTVGLILLWLSGISLIAASHGTQLFANPAFLWKLAAVFVLTALSITANVTVANARKNGTPPNALRMKRLGIGSLAMAILALVLAVVAFS